MYIVYGKYYQLIILSGRSTKICNLHKTYHQNFLFQNIWIKMNVQHEVKLLVEEMKRLGSPGKWCQIVK